MSSLDKALQSALDDRRAAGLYRSRAVVESPQTVQLTQSGASLLSFCSNDYLGLANHPSIAQRMKNAIEEFGVGSGASHLVNGHFAEHHALEEELAAFVGRPRALLFSTGYMANMGVINALVSRSDEVFEDRLNHASLLDGGLLSQAKFTRFKHNDAEDLRRLLAKSTAKRKLIVVDGIFSMDGDLANLPELAAVAKEFDAWLMVDDAHGLGCFGDGGKGTLEHFGMSLDEVPVLVGTLGKAFGTFGAFVAGSETLIESLIQFARTYIYTTALPPSVAAATRESLNIVNTDQDRRTRLNKAIKHFKDACVEKGIQLMPSPSAIQPIVIGDADKAVAVSEALRQSGFWVSAIRPPTVPAGTARLRVTLSSEHHNTQIDALVAAIAEALHAHE